MTLVGIRNRPMVILISLVGWFGVLLQAFLSIQHASLAGKSISEGLVAYFSYFTVLTNLLVCIALTAPLIAPQSAAGRFFVRSKVIAWVATSILYVGLSYHVLLRNVWNPQGLQLLCDQLLHYVMPVLFLSYWWFNSPKSDLRWRHPFVWGIYPTAYFGYALILGALTGAYAYGFIDVGALGYRQTMLNAFSLLFVFIALGLLLVALARLRRPGPNNA